METNCRFKAKLVKMIKDSHGKFDDYSLPPKVRQILLRWGYELKKKICYNFLSLLLLLLLLLLFFDWIKDELLSI